MENYCGNILMDLFQNAKEKKVVIPANDGYWRYKTKFDVRIAGEHKHGIDEDVLCVNIPNFSLLEKKVEDYLEIARDFYKEDKSYFGLDGYGYDKHLLFFLFTNMTFYGADNIYDFVDEHTKLLKGSEAFAGENFNFGHYCDGEKIDFDIEIKIDKNRSNMEAPLKFEIVLKKNNQTFILPTIHFGIDGEKAFIAGVQNLHTSQEGELVKTLGRYFRKVNKNIDSESIEANVSPNAVVSMALFLKFLRDRKIKEVAVPDFMPIRYSSSLECRKDKAKRNQQNDNDVCEMMDRDQFNMTNKLMYLMLRMGKCFDNLKVLYNETKNQMEIEFLDKTITNNGNVIQQIYDCARCDNLKKGREEDEYEK